MLRVAREASGMTRTQSAERLGVALATVSRWESGARFPSTDDLERLAQLYGVRPSFFTAPAREASLTASDLHYRRRKGITVSAMKQLEARTNLMRIGALNLLDQVDLDPPLHIPDQPDRAHAPEAAARDVRRGWGLPIGPVDDLTGLLEQAGVIVVLADFPADGLDGVSMWAGIHPIMYLRADAPMDRRRFTMAHELGHLVLHRDGYEDDQAEQQANAFAAEFLMPADQIRPELRRLDLDRAYALKLHWQVAISALIVRASTIGAITKEQATRLHKQRSYRRWTKDEPGSTHLPAETPTTLQRVREVLLEHGMTDEDLAELLHLPDVADHAAFHPPATRSGLRLIPGTR